MAKRGTRIERSKSWLLQPIDDGDDLELLPCLPGIYVIYIWDETAMIYRLCYVGSSINIRQRMKSHIRAEYQVGDYGKSRQVKLVLDNLYKMDMIVDGTEPYLVKYRIAQRLGEWLMGEYRLIYRLRPPCNRVLTIIPELEAYMLIKG